MSTVSIPKSRPIFFVGGVCSDGQLLQILPDNVVHFTKAALALHNYLRSEEGALYCPAGFVDGEDGSGNIIHGTWREEETPGGFQPIGSVAGNR